MKKRRGRGIVCEGLWGERERDEGGLVLFVTDGLVSNEAARTASTYHLKERGRKREREGGEGGGANPWRI